MLLLRGPPVACAPVCECADPGFEDLLLVCGLPRGEAGCSLACPLWTPSIAGTACSLCPQPWPFPGKLGHRLARKALCPTKHFTHGVLSPTSMNPVGPGLLLCWVCFSKNQKCVCVDSLIAFLIYLVTAKPDSCSPLWGCTAACIPACGQGLAASPAQSWVRQPWAGRASLGSGHHTLPRGFTVQQMLGTFVPDRWNLPGLGRPGVPWGVPSAQEGWPCSVL